MTPTSDSPASLHGYGNGASILLVNDTETVRYAIRRMLENAGFVVTEAADGEECLSKVRQLKPRLVILDIRMPGIDGLEVCRRIKANDVTASIKVLHIAPILVSAEFRVRSMESGADGYLTHPFEPEELIATARSLIRLFEAEQKLRDTAAELREANTRTHEFLAMLAHELRNPLSAITTCLPLLERAPARDKAENLGREILQRQTLQLRRLVDDLLDVARVTQGKIEPQWDFVDLGALLLTAGETTERTRLKGRQQKLHVDLPAHALRMRGDAVRLEQIFTNLLENASKYSEVGGQIELVATDLQLGEKDWVSVRIRDNGVGIAPDMLPKIFDLFAQADVPLARSRGGLGIGLTLVRSLVLIHGGTVRVTSGGLGKGSEFEVRLPLLAQSELRVSDTRVPEVSTGIAAGRRVLVVEDNPDVQTMLRMLLESWGHQVWVASDGSAGMEAIESIHPDVALIDIGLPSMDGYEVARRIASRGLARRPLMIALTGYNAPEQRERALKCGFDVHLAKPADPELLMELLHRPSPYSAGARPAPAASP